MAFSPLHSNEAELGVGSDRKDTEQRSHSMELDGLRGLAILGVVMTHLSGFWFSRTRLPLEVPLLQVDLLQLFQYGSLGVMLFFLLSGYLLTWTEEKRARRGSYRILSYAKRRALRLIPAYYVSMVVVVVLWPNTPSFDILAIHLMFLQGFVPEYLTVNSVVWSLTPEVVFYLALPFLILKLHSTYQRLAILGVLLIVSFATRILMSSNAFDVLPIIGDSLGGPRMYFFPTTFLYLFLVGMLLRMMVERTAVTNGSLRWRRPLALGLTIVPVAVIAVFPYVFLKQYASLSSPQAMIAESMLILISVSALLGSPLLKPLLNFRPLVFVGKISYSLFLLHTTVIFLMIRHLLPEVKPWLLQQSGLTVWASFVVYVVSILSVAIAVSYLSYRFVESPFLRRKPAK